MSPDLFVQYFLMFAIVFDASIAWFVLLKNPKRAVNQAYFFIFLMVALWQSSHIFHYVEFSHETALILVKLSYAAAAIVISAALYFVRIILQQKHNYFIFAGYMMFGVILFLIAQSGGLIIDDAFIDLQRGYMYHIAGPGFSAFTFVLLSMLATILIDIIIQYFKSQEAHDKIKLQYILLAFLVPIVVGSVSNLLIPYFLLIAGDQIHFEYYSIQNIGPASTIFLSALTAYAILRHRLMDIKAVIRRNVIGAVVYVITLGVFFLAGYYIVQRELTTLGLTELSSLTLILAIVLVLAWPLYVGVKRLTRRLIKPQIIDIHKWSDLEQQQLAKVETTEQVARLVAAHFQRVIPVTHYTCVAYNHDEFYEVVYSDLPARKFDVNEPWLQALQEHHHKMISAPDTRIFTADIHQLSGSTAQRASLQRLAERYQAQFILPLATDDFFIGALLIGDKINGQPFSAEELHNMEAMRGLATQTLLNVLRLRKLVKTDVADYEARLERRATEGVAKKTAEGMPEAGREDTEAI